MLKVITLNTSWSAPSTPKQTGKQKLQLNSEVPVEEKRKQEQSASRLQSHPHPRDRLVSISALHGPQAKDHLTNGNWSTETQEIKRRFQKAKDKQKYHYDHHGTRQLPPLKPGDHVRMKPEHGSKEWKAATVVQSHASLWLYVVVQAA